jgi:hypothetical protein
MVEAGLDLMVRLMAVKRFQAGLYIHFVVGEYWPMPSTM